MNNHFVGFWVIVTLQLLPSLALGIITESAFERGLAAFLVALAVGLICRINLVRIIWVFMFYLNAVVLGLVLSYVSIHSIVFSDLPVDVWLFVLGAAFNIAVIAYSWWAARYLSRPDIKRWFARRKKRAKAH